MFKIPADVVLLPEQRGRWVAMNVFSRTCLAVDTAALQVLRAAESLSKEELSANFKNRTFETWDVSIFPHGTGLLSDPTGYIREVSSWPVAARLTANELVSEFVNHFILIDDEVRYRDRFQDKTSLLDGEHFGNFHQQLGQFLMLVQRQNPSIWWVSQKFTEDLSDVRNNLYGAVQTSYLRKYVSRRFTQDDYVVDLGCGIGFYSNLIATSGATVMGIDPNPDYIAVARSKATPRTRFDVAQIGQKGALDSVESGVADYVFMSDALLFYFVPIQRAAPPNLEILFSDIRRILKPSGIFISLEPHSIFWLAPWLGEVDRPFTIITEYLCRSFAVTPHISRLIQSYTKSGFAVTWMEELTPDPTFKKVDERAYQFAGQFPLWHLFELQMTSS